MLNLDAASETVLVYVMRLLGLQGIADRLET